MLSVIIATDGAEEPAVATLSSLVAGAASGIVRDVVLVDGAASDTIMRVADVAGCTYLAAPGRRGRGLAQGAAQARAPWLLFLIAGAMPDPSWIDESGQFIRSVAISGQPRAAYFRYARSPYAVPGWRDHLHSVARWLGRISPSQGLLIARDHLERLGGFDPDADQPEIALLRRLGRARMQMRTGIVRHYPDS